MPLGRTESAYVHASRRARVLAQCHAFAQLRAERLTELAASSQARRFVRGQRLFTEGEPCETWFALAAGVVKVSRENPGAGGRMLSLFGPGECVGTVAALLATEYPATAVAATETVEALTLPAPLLRELVRRDVEAASALSRSLLRSAEVSSSNAELSGCLSQRLARLLLSLAERFGDELGSGGVVVPLSLSRAELAALLDASPEAAAVGISELQRRGVLRLSAWGFELLAPYALRALARGAQLRADSQFRSRSRSSPEL